MKPVETAVGIDPSVLLATDPEGQLTPAAMTGLLGTVVAGTVAAGAVVVGTVTVDTFDATGAVELPDEPPPSDSPMTMTAPTTSATTARFLTPPVVIPAPSTRTPPMSMGRHPAPLGRVDPAEREDQLVRPTVDPGAGADARIAGSVDRVPQVLECVDEPGGLVEVVRREEEAAAGRSGPPGGQGVAETQIRQRPVQPVVE
jgi:hypothetical protein